MSIDHKNIPIVPWWRVTLRRKVSESCAVRRRNSWYRVSWAAKRAVVANRLRSRTTAVGFAVSTTPTTRWYTTGSRDGDMDDCIVVARGDGGRRRRAVPMAIRAGPTALRRTSPVPRLSSSPAAPVLDIR